MRQVDTIAFKADICNKKCNVISENFWSSIVKIVNANVIVNVNDNYIILFNEGCEAHINCLKYVYKDNESYVVENVDPLDNGILNRFRITPIN